MLEPPLEEFTHELCKSTDSADSASSVPLTSSRGTPKVGASIAVHPPKFYVLANFLEQFAACPGALQALRVFLVFTDENDLRLFRESMACLSPGVPEDVWEPVVTLPPAWGWPNSMGDSKQFVAAYKKWHGIAHMMDLADAPLYGLMMDSELELYDGLGLNMSGSSPDTREAHCSLDGPWSQLLQRTQELERSKAFPAARVSDTLVTYNFGHYNMSGKRYDQALIHENANFILPLLDTPKCKSEGCVKIHKQIDDGLFSWWTDLPWMNLSVVGRMLEWLSVKRTHRDSFDTWRPTPNWRPGGGWRQLASTIDFVRFEYVGYQQWSVLHEGFSFRDVTNITGYARWGSYLENPLPGAQLDQLQPIWVGADAMKLARKGNVTLSKERPPLLVFHVDHQPDEGISPTVQAHWKEVLRALIKHNGWCGSKDVDISCE